MPLLESSNTPNIMVEGQLLPVGEALLTMANAVRSGQIMEARGIGERCIIPLSLASSDLAFKGKISEGAESTVHRGHWRGHEVAVKKVRISTSSDLDRFRSELQLLAAMSHPAVMPLLGARALPPDYLLVLPLARGGNVRQALYDKGWRPSWLEVLSLAYSVACGMEHVHSTGIVHRDIKPTNLLLLDHPPSLTPPLGAATASSSPSTGAPAVQDLTATAVAAKLTSGASAAAADEIPALLESAVRVQITDFGIAMRLGWSGEAAGGGGLVGVTPSAAARGGKPSGGFYKRQMAGTLEYMAPELLLRTAPPSIASDVYAWAVTVNEVATGVVPFSDCTKDNPEVHTVLEMGYGRQELAAAVCAGGLRPLLRPDCPPGLAALVGACWHDIPEQRPSFSQIRQALESLTREMWLLGQLQHPFYTHLNQEQQQQQQVEGAGGAQAVSYGDKPYGSTSRGTVTVSAMAVDGPFEGTAVMTDGDDDNQGGDGDDRGHHGNSNSNCNSNGDFQAVFNGDGSGPVASTTLHTVLPPFKLCGPEEEGDREGDRTTLPLPRDYIAAFCKGGGGGGAGSSGSGPDDGRPVPYMFNAGMFEAVGPRDSMEDRFVLLSDLFGSVVVQSGSDPISTTTYGGPVQIMMTGMGSTDNAGDATPIAATAAAGGHCPVVVTAPPPLVRVAVVLDGHRGAEAAEFCRTRLAEVLAAALANCGGKPAAALRRTFVRLEEEYYTLWHQRHQRHTLPTSTSTIKTPPGPFPGTTALVALLTPDGRLFVANAGDCRAVLCRGRTALAASRDHTGLLTDERRRLAAAGVAVTWQHGGWRVGASGLQVTRCIGDFDVKGCRPAVTAAAGVTSVPEITSLTLRPEDKFLVLASDGLWDVMSPTEAVGLVYDTVKDPSLAAKRLVTEALMRGSADNVTAIVIFLAAVDTYERVYGSTEGEAFELTGTAYGSRVRFAKDRVRLAAADELRDTY